MRYKRLRDLSEDKDLSQKQPAQMLNCSQQAYCNYELGLRDIPTETLIAIAKFHNVSVDYILNLTDNPSTLKYTFPHKKR